MHSCDEASRLLSRALDEPLGLLDRSLLQLHLSMCSHCAEVDRQLKMLDTLTADLFSGDALEAPESPR